jgi:S1-C subfamily serine protease
MEPRFEGDVFAGMTLTNVTAGTPIAAMGLRPGDVIVAVAGVVLDAPEKAMAAHRAAVAANEAVVVVRRGRVEHRFTVRSIVRDTRGR